MDKIYDIIVVGCGPAGMAAALYAARSDKSVLIIEKENCGGQIALAPKVENFLSISSISGAELADKMFSQVLDLGVSFELENVESIKKIDDIFHVATDYNTYHSKSVIIATGAKHRHIGIPNEEEWVNKGFSYCVLCDGAFYKGEEVAVIGDGNSALQYALELSRYCPKVYLCTLFDKFFGDKALVNRVYDTNNIEIIQNISLVNAIGNDSLETLVFNKKVDNSEFRLNVKGAFIAIGQEPNNDIIKDLAKLDKAGYVIATEDLTTDTPGLFVAGDCRTKNVRQATTAVSDGAIAALAAVKYLG